MIKMENFENEKFSIDYTCSSTQLKSLIEAAPPIKITLPEEQQRKMILASKIEITAKCPTFEGKGNITMNIEGKIGEGDSEGVIKDLSLSTNNRPVTDTEALIACFKSYNAVLKEKYGASQGYVIN
jgi:hypothetical protein